MDWKNRFNPCFISIWIFAIVVKTSSLARTLSPVYWNTTNTNFQPDGISIEAEINDVIDIICPRQNNTPTGQRAAEYHTFIEVPVESYQNCSLGAANRSEKILLNCNRPFVENKYTLLFQAWTPYPGGSIFEAGRDYYYITTSTGNIEEQDNKEGGLCNSHNMKLKVHIKQTATTKPRVVTTQQPHSMTTPRVHTTTRRTVETKRPPPTVKPKPTKMGNKNDYGKQTGSAKQYQMSSLLLLISCLIARIRWH